MRSQAGALTPQSRAAAALASLLRLLLSRPATDKGHPNDKLVVKVCSFLGAAALPPVSLNPSAATAETEIESKSKLGGKGSAAPAGGSKPAKPSSKASAAAVAAAAAVANAAAVAAAEEVIYTAKLA